MAGLRFTIRSNITEELAKKLGAAATSAEHDLADQIAKDTEPYVPKRNGALVNGTQVYGNQIVYPGPYARVLYYGKVMVDPVTHAAGFLTEDGWKSRKGVDKVRSDRDLNISTAKNKKAQSHWFEASKAQNIEKWTQAAKGAITDGLNK